MSSILEEDIIKSSYKLGEFTPTEEPVSDFSLDEVLKLLDDRDKQWEKRLAEAIEESEKKAEMRLAEEFNKFHETVIKKKLITTINDIGESVCSLQNTTEEHGIALKSVGAKAKGEPVLDVSCNKSPNELKAEFLYPMVIKEEALSTNDVINRCGLPDGDYTSAKRIMKIVAKTHPDECVYEPNKHGRKRYFISVKGYRGF